MKPRGPIRSRRYGFANLHWKIDAGVQRLLSMTPWGESCSYLVKRYVIRSLPIDDRTFQFRARLALEILDLVRPRLALPLGEATFFEFGAGADLVGALTFHAMGVERQVLVDRNPLARPYLLEDALEKVRRLGPALGFARVPDLRGLRPGPELLDALRAGLGIEYRAPADARATGLPAEAVDVVTSNSTLEHVPVDELGPLLSECRRILRPEGWMCMRVDYEDHYGYFDPRVSPYQFLYYSDREWAKYSPALHYQNRLRHSDYLRVFEALGLEVVEQRRLMADARTLDQLDRSRLDARFRDCDPSDLSVRKCTFLLRARSGRQKV